MPKGRSVISRRKPLQRSDLQSDRDCNCWRRQRDYYRFVTAITMADPSGPYEQNFESRT